MTTKVILYQSIENPSKIEVWKTFTAACQAHGLPYNYLKRFKYPFTYKGYRFHKITLNSKL